MIDTQPFTSRPDTTAPGVEIVNEPDGDNTVPAGTPVVDPSGYPHDDGEAKHPVNTTGGDDDTGTELDTATDEDATDEDTTDDDTGTDELAGTELSDVGV